MNSYFGLISVYDNGFLPDNAFTRIHGLNFVGSGVSVLTPPVSLLGGIGIATISMEFANAYNVIGGIASVSSLSVSGISSVNFLSGTDAYYSGVVTATKFSGQIETTNVTANIINVGFITGTNAYYSGIVTASSFKGSVEAPTVVANQINVGFSTGINAYYTGIVTATSLRGNFTGPLIGEIDITNATFIGSVESVLSSVGLLVPERRIVYVDGGITRTDTTDKGLSDYASISLAIWTDIWDNAAIHGISTAGWVRGTAPADGSLQGILGQKQTFKSINQVFTWLNSRQSVDNSEIEINLYNTSDSNVGQASNKAVNNSYTGGNIVRFKRGNSHSRLSGYMWGQEHYSGHIYAPLCQLEFIEVNLNCSGQIADPNRTSDYPDFCFFGNLVIRNSRFTFNTKNEYAVGLMFQAASANNESNQTATGFLSLYWQNEASIYSGRRNANEFNMKIERLNLSQTGYLSFPTLLRGGSLIIWTRHEDSDVIHLDMNVNATINDTSIPLILMNFTNSRWIIDGGYPAALNQAYGGIDVNIDLTGSNIKTMSMIRTTQDYPATKNIIISDPVQSHSPINVAMTPNLTLESAYGVITEPLYTIYAATRNEDGSTRSDNIFAKFKNAYPTTNKQWYLSAGSVRDNVFNASVEEI